MTTQHSILQSTLYVYTVHTLPAKNTVTALSAADFSKVDATSEQHITILHLSLEPSQDPIKTVTADTECCKAFLKSGSPNDDSNDILFNECTIFYVSSQKA